MSNIMAFPCPAVIGPNGDVIAYNEPGMSLRDYFAAKAMVGVISNPHYKLSDPVVIVTQYAYAVADAMLAAREVKP